MSNEYIKNVIQDYLCAGCHSWRSRSFGWQGWEACRTLKQATMKFVDEIVPLTDLSSTQSWQMQKKSVMAGETVPTVLEAFKGRSHVRRWASSSATSTKSKSGSKRNWDWKNLLCWIRIAVQVKCMVLEFVVITILAYLTLKIHPTHWKYTGKIV